MKAKVMNNGLYISQIFLYTFYLCYWCWIHNIHDISLNLRMDKTSIHLYIHRCFIQYTFWTFSWSKYIFLFFIQ